jgi:hypothetical protein
MAKSNDSMNDDRVRDFSANRSAEEPAPARKSRPMNRRGTRDEVEDDETADTPNIGATSGGTRSPKVLQKNRKIRRAA